LVRLEAMRREPVLVRADRHGPDPQLVRRAEAPDRDLATIRRHQLAKYGHRTILGIGCGRIGKSAPSADQLRSGNPWRFVTRAGPGEPRTPAGSVGWGNHKSSSSSASTEFSSVPIGSIVA